MTEVPMADKAEWIARCSQLEAEVTKLQQLTCDFQAASMLDVGSQGGPCRVEPKHLEQEVTRLRNAEADLKKALELLRRWYDTHDDPSEPTDALLRKHGIAIEAAS